MAFFRNIIRRLSSFDEPLKDEKKQTPVDDEFNKWISKHDELNKHCKKYQNKK